MLAVILTVIIVTLAGSLLPIELPKWLSLAILVVLMVVSLTVLLPEAWSSLGIWLLVPLAFGLWLEGYAAVCGHDQVHGQTGSPAAAVIAVSFLLIHSFFDGHLLAEFQFGVIGLAILFHKFLDGLSVEVLAYDLKLPWRWVLIALIVLAAPLGALILPATSLSPQIDGVLLSFVSGLYLATVWSLHRGTSHHLHH